MSDQKQFQEAVKREYDHASALFLDKNKDYGNSFVNVMELYDSKGINPMLAAMPRLEDKFGRIENLVLNNHKAAITESVVDNLRDLSAYCLMTAAWLEMGGGF